MKNNFIIFCSLIMTIFSILSCTDDNKTINTTEFTLTATLPEGFEDPSISDMVVKFTNVNTGRVINNTSFANNQIQITLPEGMYHISMEGVIRYKREGENQEGRIRGYEESVNISGPTASLATQLFISQASSDFIIAEIFFTGTVTEEGKQYNGDKYIKIYNNTNNVLYADGLSILESEFMTVDKQDYTPDIMKQAMAVSSIITIPGNGTQYPVNPGEYIIIADNGINHQAQNSNSIDLSKADFEIFYEDSDDIDNPDVPNMLTPYDKFGFHNRGFHSYAIARLGDIETYLQNYKYDYEYLFVFEEYEFPMEESCYKVPNEMIVDAVNLSVQSEFQWIVTSPAIDMGWTYCGAIDGDEKRYGKSVLRKTFSTTEDGRAILQDSNNSTEDFIPEATPSLKK